MSYDFSLMLSPSNRPWSHTGIRRIPALSRRTSGLFLAAATLLALSSSASAIEKNPATEWLQENVQNAMQPADILALLNDTVGANAASGVNASPHALRQGLSVTAIPRQSDILLRFQVDRGDTGTRYTIAEVAISDDLGARFFQFVQAALASAASVPLTDAQPWQLGLTAKSELGGQLTIGVRGDASAHFTLSWDFSSPRRPIDNFIVPTASRRKKSRSEHIDVTVHFPTSLEQFQFLRTIYSSEVTQRFQDVPLYPHTWLHLTVLNGSTDRYVVPHFDAIATTGQRLFVSEAPASTDVGGRFLDETLTRMNEMLNAEAVKPGSAGDFETSFPYEDPEYGVVIVVVTGKHGSFDVSYELQTGTEEEAPDHEADH